MKTHDDCPHREFTYSQRMAWSMGYNEAQAQLESILRELLAHDWAATCEECGIGQSAAWKRAQALVAKPIA